MKYTEQVANQFAPRAFYGPGAGSRCSTRQTISGWGGIDHKTGAIVEMRHEKRGQSFAGKVLIFPGAKGSSGWSHYFHMARIAGVAPRAMVFNVMTTKVALGAVVVRAPVVTGLDRDPLDVIEDGDWVKVDGENGLVEVTKLVP